MVKKSISIWCFHGTNLRESIAMAKQVGFDGIELALNEQGEMSLEWSPFQVKEIYSYANDLGIPISSFASGLGWKYPPVSRNAEVSAKGKEIIKTALRFAGILEVDCLLTVPAVVGPEMPYDEAYSRGVEVYQELARMGEEFGVVVGVENVWNKFLLSPLEFARFIDDVGSPWVQAYFDVGNVLQFALPEQWIRILGPRIKKVHVKDFKTSVGNIHGFTTLLNGDVNWPAVMQALRDVGYDDYLVAEVGAPALGAPNWVVGETSQAMSVILGM